MRRSSPTARATPLALLTVIGLGAAAGCFSDPGRTSMSTGSSEGGSETGDPNPGSSTGAPTSGELTTGELTTGEASTGASTGALPGSCGDYRLDPGEECDNGETNNGQGGSICKANCTKNVCGDGYIAANEDCDDGNQIADDACSNVCTLNDCGDGNVGPGEQCDDGNQVDGDACTNKCTLQVCGDGSLGPGEQCDDGAANADDQACQLDCTDAACGDGVVHTGVEGCDDGNAVEDDGCSNSCALPGCGDGVLQADEGCDDGNLDDDDGCSSECEVTCGDGVLDPNEECDDGNTNKLDTCSPSCKRSAFLVFVTSKRFVGKFGGVTGANVACNAAAESAKLPGAGKYKAWISDSNDDPIENLFKSKVPYWRPDGVAIADDWDDLLAGSLLAPISVNEVKQTVVGGLPDCNNVDKLVWTNTTAAALLDTEANCTDWGSDQPTTKAGLGNLLQVSSAWTESCELGCNSMARLYCFEQP